VTLEGRDIVCVGCADWDAEIRTNQHHLMSRLARDNRVLFVESLGLRQPQFAARDLRRALNRLLRGIAPPRAVDDGLYVLSPLVLPFHRYSFVRAINGRLLPFLIRRAVRRLGIREPVLWSYNPQAEALIDTLRPSAVIYHCVDDIAAQKGVDAESFREAEQRYTASADVVFATSEPLAERMRTLSSRVVALPNAAETGLFAEALHDGPVDESIGTLPQPRIVFIGAVVATKLDFDLIVSLARTRPEWSFALVGPVGAGDPSTDVSALEAEPNIHLLGPRPHDALPEVLRGADAGFIPYALNDLTASVFPLKIYEYLAAGLPVVTTPLPALEGVEGVVTAADAETLAARLEELLASDDSERRSERSRLASGHSWDTRLEEMLAAIASNESGNARIPVAGGSSRSSA
jgi:glycosyltransferase involved in cell wall biosynthesis